MAEVQTSDMAAKPPPVSLGLSRLSLVPLLGYTGIHSETMGLIVVTYC
jgi:hypothetical protein